MFVLGVVVFVVGAVLSGAHYLGFASQIPGLDQLPALQVVGPALTIAGAVLAILFRRPAD
ncbi:MAG TPA: hypothetical protein PLM14_09485 [Candidatus Hydrogenedentes bacterium]|nr:hypothetical protein [Candidatus Hydrogenedentota bacterium]